MKMKTAVAVLLMVPAVAAADCVEGLRSATPQEQAFYEKISVELHRLIPPPPAGCRLSTGSKAGTMKWMCGNEKTDEFSRKSTLFVVNDLCILVGEHDIKR